MKTSTTTNIRTDDARTAKRNQRDRGVSRRGDQLEPQQQPRPLTFATSFRCGIEFMSVGAALPGTLPVRVRSGPRLPRQADFIMVVEPSPTRWPRCSNAFLRWLFDPKYVIVLVGMPISVGRSRSRTADQRGQNGVTIKISARPRRDVDAASSREYSSAASRHEMFTARCTSAA